MESEAEPTPTEESEDDSVIILREGVLEIVDPMIDGKRVKPKAPPKPKKRPVKKKPKRAFVPKGSKAAGTATKEPSTGATSTTDSKEPLKKGNSSSSSNDDDEEEDKDDDDVYQPTPEDDDLSPEELQARIEAYAEEKRINSIEDSYLNRPVQPPLPRGSGKIQIIRHTVSGQVSLRFLNFHVRNDEKHILYVLVLREHVKSFYNNTNFLQNFEKRAEKVLLDVGIAGQVKGYRASGTFDQDLSSCFFEPLDIKSVIICKPVRAKPPSIYPEVHVFANLQVYVDRSTNVDTVAAKREALTLELSADTDANFDEKEFTPEEIKDSAHEIFHRFDKDHSGTIDFEEFSRMLAFRGIKILEPTARRFFIICDEDGDGEIDTDEFEMALYITNYLRKRSNVLPLIPADAFYLFDSNRDGLLNFIEYEQALSMMLISSNGKLTVTSKQIQRTFEKLDAANSRRYIDASQFKSAFLSLVNEEDLLRKLGIAFQPTRFYGTLNLSRRNKILLSNAIDAQEAEELQEAVKAKNVCLEIQRTRREAAQLASRETNDVRTREDFKAKTMAGLAARKAKMEKKRERQKIAALRQEEVKLRERLAREEELRATFKMEAKMEAMAATRESDSVARAVAHEDLLTITDDKSLSSLPKNLYTGRVQLAELSSYLYVNLSRNNLLSPLPANFFYNLDRMQKLDLSENSLTNLPNEISQCVSLRILNLRKNHLKELPETWTSCSDLQLIDLSFNDLQRLPSFKSFEKLKILLVMENHLTELPLDIGSASTCHTIDVRGNDLEMLPESFGCMRGLKRAELSSNRLRRLMPNNFINLAKLQYMSLEYNDLRQLPADMGKHCYSLQYLNVAHNNLVSLPSSFKFLVNLLVLRAEKNCIRILPDAALRHMTSVEDVHLEFNQLVSLPPGVGGLVHLKNLVLRSNSLRTIPLEVGALRELLVLDVAHNQLSSLPEEVGYMTSLENLNLSHNIELKTVTPAINQFQFLSELKCQSISLTDHHNVNAAIQFLTTLKVLDLSHNYLKVFPERICALETLSELYLTANVITYIPSNVNHLQNLKILDLYNNRLQALPTTLPLDIDLRLDRNPMTVLIREWWNDRNHHPIIPDSKKARQLSNETLRDWLSDQAVYYNAMYRVWNLYGHSLYLASNDPSLVDHFVNQVKKNVKSWENRYVSAIKKWYYHLKKVGELPSLVSSETSEKVQAWKEEKIARREAAIGMDNIRQDRIKVKYAVTDPMALVRESETRFAEFQQRERVRKADEITSFRYDIAMRYDDQEAVGKKLVNDRSQKFTKEMRSEMSERERIKGKDREAEARKWELYRHTGKFLD